MRLHAASSGSSSSSSSALLSPLPPARASTSACSPPADASFLPSKAGAKLAPAVAAAAKGAPDLDGFEAPGDEEAGDAASSFRFEKAVLLLLLGSAGEPRLSIVSLGVVSCAEPAPSSSMPVPLPSAPVCVRIASVSVLLFFEAPKMSPLRRSTRTSMTCLSFVDTTLNKYRLGVSSSTQPDSSSSSSMGQSTASKFSPTFGILPKRPVTNPAIVS
mmetsp:Transcript_20532/g.41388  ORF Transcript_20532/g.41388 Transcript_20532/m.41388 type:complete len:216 (+) Transcript_20532:433-1080(+)